MNNLDIQFNINELDKTIINIDIKFNINKLYKTIKLFKKGKNIQI